MPEYIAIIIGIVFIALYVVILGIAAAQYIVSSLAIQTLAKRRLIKHSFLAWIPIAQNYIIGALCDDYDAKNGIKRNWKAVLLVFYCIVFGLMALMYAAMIIFVFSVQNTLLSIDTIPQDAIAPFVLMYVFIIFMAFAAQITATLQAVCIYKIFESTVPQKAVKYMIISFLIPLGYPICLYKCSKKGYENTPAQEFAYSIYEPDSKH